MLKTIKVTNFYSIGETQELSLEIKNKDVLNDSAIKTDDGTAINLIACLVGHNASGKTTMLRAITFLYWFIENSYTSLKEDQRIPVEPHKLRESKPVKLEIEFFSEGTLFNYIIELTRKEIIREYLGKHVDRAFTRVFEYIRTGEDWDFNPAKLKINQSDLDRFKSRKNVSVLSSLIDTGYLKEISIFKNGHSNVSQLGYIQDNLFSKFLKTSEKLHENTELRKRILSFIENIDIGISDFKFNEWQQQSQKNPAERIKRQMLECVHESRSGTFNLDLIEESNGTLHSVYFLSEFFPVLEHGSIAVVDEIEDSLHPHVVKKIISLFESKKTNPNKAQLIFATHQHLLLNDRTKTQIFLAEKDGETFETEIYRLDDVEGVRNDENYFQKYIAGVYGGTPQIHWF